MVRISKQKVDADILLRIHDALIQYVAWAKDKNQATSLVNVLLTESERIMLGKRLAVVILLAQGHRYESIEQALKVSHVTISKLKKEYDKGKFEKVIKVCKKKPPSTYTTSTHGSIWNELEILLQAGMPLQGKGRWKHVYNIIDEGKQKKLRRRKQK